MNKWVKENLWGLLTLTGIIAAVIWFTKADLRMFTDAEKRMETEKFMENADLDKVYGEYILDSIEEVQTRAWRKQQEVKDSIFNKRIDSMMGFIKLTVHLQDKTLKKSDTINSNVEHALDDLH